MSYAQKIYLAGLGLLQLLRKAGIDTQEIQLALYSRLEAWCAQAQVQEGGKQGNA